MEVQPLPIVEPGLHRNEIPLFFEPKIENPAEDTYPFLTVFLLGIIFTLARHGKETFVESMANYYMELEPWSPENMQLAVFLPVVADIALSSLVLLSGQLVLGLETMLYPFLGFNVNVNNISLLPYLLGKQHPINTFFSVLISSSLLCWESSLSPLGSR